MEKIAIFGGSFDPPHEGHKLLSRNLAEFCHANKVIVMPTAMSPFKNSSGASSGDRLEMCKIAFYEPLYQVSDIEIRRGGKSYTIDTVKEIKKAYPEAELFLFMGEDMLLSFTRWYKYEEILSLCKIVAACRTENREKLQEMKDYCDTYLGGVGNRVLVCENIPVEISSTQVRESLKKGEKTLVSEEIYKFIRSKGLYMSRNAEYMEILKGRMSEQRYIHSLNVADSAKELAILYGADPEKAYTTGLVHDSCKDVAPGLQLSYMLENGVQLTQLEMDTAKLYHAICGSVFARKEFNIDDEDMLNAIRYHTTGRKGMSLLEKIVFIADFISAERDYNGVDVMREKAVRSLDEAIVEGLSFTIKDLIDNERLVHPDTIDAYNDAQAVVLKQKQEK